MKRCISASGCRNSFSDDRRAISPSLIRRCTDAGEQFNCCAASLTVHAGCATVGCTITPIAPRRILPQTSRNVPRPNASPAVLQRERLRTLHPDLPLLGNSQSEFARDQGDGSTGVLLDWGHLCRDVSTLRLQHRRLNVKVR